MLYPSKRGGSPSKPPSRAIVTHFLQSFRKEYLAMVETFPFRACASLILRHPSYGRSRICKALTKNHLDHIVQPKYTYVRKIGTFSRDTKIIGDYSNWGRILYILME